MVLRMARPTRRKDSSFIWFRKRIPADIQRTAGGQRITFTFPADVSGDPQPFHLDDEIAKRTMFGGLVASGWHTAAITMRLLVEGGAPIAGGIIGAGGEITWPRPSRPGDINSTASCSKSN
jgi:hypothetical protein